MSSNSITLSTDMNTLYLIDDERAIPFDLTTRGATIGVIAGEVSVVTARPTGKIVESKLLDRKDVPVVGNQWTVMYNNDNKLFHVVGALDIELTRIEIGKDAKSKSMMFDLSRTTVTIRRAKESLTIEVLPITQVTKA